MPRFFSSQPPTQHNEKEDESPISSQEPTVRVEANPLSYQETPREMTQKLVGEENSPLRISSFSSDGAIYLKRLYAHYTTKKLSSGSPSLIEDLGLEEAAAEATASYAAWKKMQEQLAQIIRHTHHS